MKSFEKVVSHDQLFHDALRAPLELVQGVLFRYGEANGRTPLNPVPAEIRRLDPAYGMLVLDVNYGRCIDVSVRFLSRELSQSNLRGWDLLDAGIHFRETLYPGSKIHFEQFTGVELKAHPVYSKMFHQPVVDYTPIGAVHVVGDITRGVSPVKLQLRLDPQFELVRTFGANLQVVKSFAYDSVPSYVEAQYRANACLEQMKQWDLVHTHRNGL